MATRKVLPPIRLLSARLLLVSALLRACYAQIRSSIYIYIYIGTYFIGNETVAIQTQVQTCFRSFRFAQLAATLTPSWIDFFASMSSLLQDVAYLVSMLQSLRERLNTDVISAVCVCGFLEFTFVSLHTWQGR